MPMISEIAPLLIVIKLEQYDYAGAAAIGVVMLLISFVLLLLINLLQRWKTAQGRTEPWPTAISRLSAGRAVSEPGLVDGC